MTRLTVLGCSGSYPGPGSACSGYLVEGGGVAVALDLGSGTLANLHGHLDVGELDGIVLSHSHADHWVDLTGLEVMFTYRLHRVGVPVFGTAETRVKAEALMGDLSPTFDWQVVGDGDRCRIGGLDVTFSRTDHYVDTLAVRIDGDGTSLAYSADTGPAWSFDALGGGIDLALCEATFLADRERDGLLHLSARQAGAMAAAAGVDRLVLTHREPGIDPDAYRAEGDAAFGRPVEIAVAGACYEL